MYETIKIRRKIYLKQNDIAIKILIFEVIWIIYLFLTLTHDGSWVDICLPQFLWRRQWHPTPVLLPGKSRGQMSLVGCGPWGREELDTTERLPIHFSLSCIGEGNGNPLQCSCLENPRMGEPGGLLSMGSHRVGHDWSDLAAAGLIAVYWFSPRSSGWLLTKDHAE